jgi:hypothetical protein
MRSTWIMMGCIAAFLAAMVVSTSNDFSDDEPAPADPALATAPVDAPPVGPMSEEPSAPVGPDEGPGVVAMPDPVAPPARACTADCPDSEAGYAWAEAHRISDAAGCSADSEPFAEGCRLYVEIQTALSNHDDDGPVPVE